MDGEEDHLAGACGQLLALLLLLLEPHLHELGRSHCIA